MSAKDFFPDSYKNQNTWSKNIGEKGSAQIAGVEGWDAARITAFLARVQQIEDSSQAILNAQAVLEAAVGTHEANLKTILPEVRKDLGNLKKSRGWNEGKGDVLEINTPAASFDPAGYKPILAVEEKHARNELMVKKKGADSVDIYWRKKGETAWKLLAAKRVRFPVDDDTPSATGAAEEREYQAIGVVADEEIGQPSDIASAVWRP
jgi:hypothetical protein